MVALTKALLGAAAAQYVGNFSSSVIAGFDWRLTDLPWRTANIAGCSIETFVPKFPSGQTQLVAPSTPPQFIGLAFGVQNYTCSSPNNWTNVGAVAELLDASCFAFDPAFPTIQNDMFNFWNTVVSQFFPIQAIIDLLHLLNPPTVLAQHYFVPNPVTGQGVSPKWDFTSSGTTEGNSTAFIVAKGKGNIPSPDDPKNDVAWLDVVNVEGQIASEVFRFDTVGGQPPSTCTPGQSPDLSVKYVSKYIFY